MLYTSFPDYVTSVSTIVKCMLIGIIIAAFLMLYYKYVLGAFIRHLLASKAQTPETAIRLDSTKFVKNPFLIRAIKGGTQFKNVLRATEPTVETELSPKPTAKKKRQKIHSDIVTRKYYIPYELTFRADNLYNKKGTNALAAVLTVVLFIFLAMAALVVIPDLLTMLNNFIGGL